MRVGKGAKGGRGDGLIAAMADWTLQEKRRTPEGAIMAIARRRRMAVDDMLDSACDEIGYDRRHWQARRVVGAVCDEIETRQKLRVVEIPDGEAAARSFRIGVKLDWISRIAMGLLARYDSAYFTRGYFARDIGDALAARCRAGKFLAATFTKAVASVGHRPEDGAGAGRECRDVLTAAPDVLAMPDDDAPAGFTTLDESMAKRQATARI